MKMGYNRTALMATMVLLGLTALVIFSMEPAGATISGDAPPVSGDWVVNTPTYVSDEVVYLEGNLTVNGLLALDQSVLQLNVSQPGDFSVVVTPTGRLVAQGSTFQSGSATGGYGFRVTGRVDLRGCTVSGMEDGLRILTALPQVISATSIVDFHLAGLYLEGASGTVLQDVTIQSDRFESAIDIEKAFKTDGKYEFYLVPGTGPLHIKGGHPTIDGLTMSVNGSLSITGQFEYRASAVVNVRLIVFPLLALIDTKDDMDLVNVEMMDCAMSVSAFHTLDYLTDIGTKRHVVQTIYYMSPILLHNTGNVTATDVHFRDVRLGTTSLGSVVTGGTATVSQTLNGCYSILALTDEVYHGSDLHTISISLTDSTFLRSSALYVMLAPVGLDDSLTQLSVDILVDSIEVRQNAAQGSVKVDTWPTYQNIFDMYFEMMLSNSTFAENGATSVMVSLTDSPAFIRHDYPATPSTAWSHLYNNVTFENNDFIENYATSISVSHGSSARLADSLVKDEAEGGTVNADIYEWVRVHDNVFGEHAATTAILTLAGAPKPHAGTERGYVERNVFSNAMTSTVANSLVTLTAVDVIRFCNNTFSGNDRASGLKIFTLSGDAETPEPASILIADNVFTGNRFWHNNEASMGTIILTHGGDAEVTGNSVSGDSSRAFLNVIEKTQFSGYSRVNFHDNTFYDSPDMTGIVYLKSYDVYHQMLAVFIEDNLVRDCGVATLLDFYDPGPPGDLNDWDPRIVVSQNLVANATGEVIRALGDIQIDNNTFTNCKGYVLDMLYLNLYIPVIMDNDFTGCHDLIYMTGKTKCLGGLQMTMEGKDLDCTGNALRFSNIQVVLSGMTVSDRASPAVIAENSVISIVGGRVKVGSGRIIGTGSITRYYGLEATVTWSDSTGVGSGIPAVDVPVVLLDSRGRSTFTRSTDDGGNLGSLLVPAWSIRSMFVLMHTPHTLIIGTAGIASSMSLTFDHDFVGPNALRLHLIDDRLPVVRITNPVSGQWTRTGDITVSGYVLEMGSGIDEVQLTVGGGTPVMVTPDRTGLFEMGLTDLPEGDIAIVVTAVDIAGNVGTGETTISVDRTPPDVNVLEPGEGVSTPLDRVPLVVAVEDGTTVYVNGLLQTTVGGVLSTTWPLSEGENLLIITAIDEAGNVANVNVAVTRDTIAPRMTVTSPRTGLLANTPTISVEGETEPGVMAWLLVLVDGVELRNLTLDIDEDGLFSIDVDLDEGESELLLRARDAAGNDVTARSTVAIDTAPPPVSITSPPDGTLLSDGLVRVTGTAEPGCLVRLNGLPVDPSAGIDVLLALGEGENRIDLVAIDPAGNEAVSTVTVMVDTLAPVIGITRPLLDHVVTSDPDLEVAGYVTGDLATLTVMGGDVAVTDGSFATTLTFTQEGTVTVEFVATDAAGNTATRTIVVDVSWTGPSISVDLRTDGGPGTSSNGTVLLVGTLAGDCDAITVIRTGASGQHIQGYIVGEGGSFTIACRLEKGENTIVVRAVDAHGNVDETTPQSIKYSPTSAQAGEEGMGPFDIGVVLLAVGLALLVTVLVVDRFRP